MNRIAKFEKVSFEQFSGAYKDDFGGTDDEIRKVYDKIELPRPLLGKIMSTQSLSIFALIPVGILIV